MFRGRINRISERPCRQYSILAPFWAIPSVAVVGPPRQLSGVKLPSIAFGVSETAHRQLKSLNRQVLTHGGVVKAEKAKAHAHAGYQRFDERRRLARHAEADAALAELKATEKRLPKTKRGKPR